jgi:phospholipase C
VDTAGVTRRGFLAEGTSAIVAASAAGRFLAPRRRVTARAAGLAEPRADQVAALRALGRSTMRLPDSLPDATRAIGTDTMPEIEHVVLLMLENHSYDNFLGMLGRGKGETPRGDGFTLAKDRLPTATNAYADGRQQRAFRMPNTCQKGAVHVSQEWTQSHVQYADGRLDGFVISDSGAAAMGYWQRDDLPFTYGLATEFPVADRWFCSCLGQTDPNRRFLIAATSSGMVDTIGGNVVADVTLALPSSGTIFERLGAAGISWIDYYDEFPVGATCELYPITDTLPALRYARPIAQFYTDAAAGKLPAFSLVDPNYGTESQENPQNIAVGEGVLEKVVRAIGSGPAWRKTLFILTYDEHGGYYDHVPPPPALQPDLFRPVVQPGQKTYEGFRRYGFRVPTVVVSPYAKKDYVSHTVYDHTSILAFLERKWNLPAMTMRDANANDITDMLDMQAMAAGQPTFPDLPPLPAAGNTPAALACSNQPAVPIPPPASVSAAPAHRLSTSWHGRARGGAALELKASGATYHHVVVELRHAGHTIASAKVARVGSKKHRVLLRGRLAAGNYTLRVRHDGRTLVSRHVRLH